MTDTLVVDTDCASAFSQCVGLAPQGVQMMWIYSRRVVGAVAGPWTRTGGGCLQSRPGVQAVAGTPVLTVREFRRLPLPAGVTHIQPGNGRTLINVPTNVYVDAKPLTLTTTLLGRPVQVRATPTTYTWAFGDGTTLPTTDPGAPYPDLRVTHTYLAPGTVRIGLTTTYRGEYSTDSGATWLPVDGTATVATAPVPLTAVEARAELVASPLPSS